MTELKPWVKGPFELILHAEIHLRNGEDYDRRLALISFDNSIEIAITTYLSLKPIQRGGNEYERKDVEKWLENYHTKLDFFMQELSKRGLPEEIGKDIIVWYHDHRNEQYHGGTRGVPEKEVLEGIKKAALWIFSILYDAPDIETVLDEAVKGKEAKSLPERDKKLDRLIDSRHGVVEIAGEPYYTSEAIHKIDPFSYQNIATEIQAGIEAQAESESEEMLEKLREKYGLWLCPELVSVYFVHHDGAAELAIVSDTDGGSNTYFMPTDMIIGPYNDLLFPPYVPAQENADRFINECDPYSIIMITGLFTEEASKVISEAHEKGTLEQLEPPFPPAESDE